MSDELLKFVSGIACDITTEFLSDRLDDKQVLEILRPECIFLFNVLPNGCHDLAQTVLVRYHNLKTF